MTDPLFRERNITTGEFFRNDLENREVVKTGFKSRGPAGTLLDLFILREKVLRGHKFIL
jgi:hypothetical protein